MATTKIRCSCKHEFQDKKYGRQIRIGNLTMKEPKGKKFRCTACGEIK